MKYKLLIKKCDNAGRAAFIAEEIAKWSGSDVSVLRSALVQKSICIRREADEDEARKIRDYFAASGIEIELKQIVPEATMEQPSYPTTKTASSESDDDEEDIPGRTLTEEEYLEKCKARPDIFQIDTEHRFRNIQIACLLFGASLGAWLTSLQMMQVATDFYEKMPDERSAKLVTYLPETLQEQKKDEKKAEEELKTEKKELKPNKNKGAGGQTGGGGDPRARITKKGVLGIISGQVRGKTVASADIFGKGGFAAGIDAVLAGIGGLKGGGSGGVGRRGVAGIGYGAGYGSGFGGGSGGIDDLIGSLMGGGGDALALKKRGGTLQISAPEFTKGGALTGGRSRASIMRVVMQNLAALRYAYNQRLRDKPGLKGRITVKFAIDEFGKVIFCEVVSSTMGDPSLEVTVTEKIKRWVFEKIDKPGDVTEVVYPFVFSQ